MQMETKMIIDVTPNTDGTYTVKYFGKEVGWMQRSICRITNKPLWRALSIHGRINYFLEKSTAKDFIISEYH